MNSQDIALVQESFEKFIPISDAAAALFYEDLFETAPEVRQLFANSDLNAQGKKLILTLSVVVRGLSQLETVLPTARDLAVRHVQYGVRPADYSSVGASLIRTLEKGLGEDFTSETKAAWTDAYALLSGVMIDAAYGTREMAS